MGEVVGRDDFNTVDTEFRLVDVSGNGRAKLLCRKIVPTLLLERVYLQRDEINTLHMTHPQQKYLPIHTDSQSSITYFHTCKVNTRVERQLHENSYINTFLCKTKKA